MKFGDEVSGVGVEELGVRALGSKFTGWVVWVGVKSLGVGI